ncbi:unnamed protein product [Clavelina lepadiformis]|uniref:Immunoglobulin domain-containing protein n=1 Tax=Clavelina lepadiformis TaxID=159417 RepID=A0ABP0FFT4_CLALP
MKNFAISLSVILQSAAIIQGQSISPLTTPHPVQATNSAVVITATASPPSSEISPGGIWIVVWRVNETVVAQAGYVSYPDVGSIVEPSIYSSQINISVVAMSASSFSTRLTIAQLKTEEDGYLVELSGPGVGPQSIVLNIRDCNSSLPYDVIVDATSRIFNSPGKFACSNGGDLFYSNSIMLTSSDTTCLASAEWSGQYNLQCWTAPIVSFTSSSVVGNKLSVPEGGALSMACDYDDVIPSGDTSRFYIDKNQFVTTKGEPFTLSSLQRSDSNKVVSCQAVTPYTDLYLASGRSSEYKLDVLYRPSFAKSQVSASNFFLEVGNDEYLIRSDQNLTLFCSSDANPAASCIWTVCGKSCENISSAHTSDCNMDYHLSTNSSISCTATNDYGFASSKMQKVTIVPLTRSVSFGKVDDMPRRDSIVTSQTGDNMTLSCHISYEDELATEFELILPNGTIVKQPILEVVSLTTADAGNYTCVTNDLFGSFDASVYLDVQYAPYQVTTTSCTWVMEETGVCDVIIFSNPEVEFASLDMNKISVGNDGLNVIFSVGQEQHYLYKKTKVTSNDEGAYSLILSHPFPPHNYSIAFNIAVINAQQLDVPAIVGGSVAAVIVVCITIVVSVYIVKRKPKQNQKSSFNSIEKPANIAVAPECIEIKDQNRENLQCQGTNGAYESIDRPLEGRDGYLAVNVGQKQNPTSQYENAPDRQNYDTIDGQYDDTI